MKKIKKSLVIIAFFMLFILLGTNNCKASGDLYLQNLNFDVKVNLDGSMDVTEIWDISIDETNTLFKTFKTDKTKYISISNVQVSDITGNVEQKFSKINELMYHVTKGCYYGLKNNDGNFEIAWGVGLDNSSAVKSYKISYTVEDGIAKYSDYAELYWQFVGSDFEIDCNNITGTITLPEKVQNKDEIKVWGHTEDLNGEIYSVDLNKIKFEVNNFRAGRYVEIRTLFPTNMISSSGRTYQKNILDKVISEETEWANAANLRRQKRENQKKGVSIVFAIICAIINLNLLKQSIELFKKASQKEKIKPTLDIKYYREMPRKDATPSQALFIFNNSASDFTPKEMGRIFSATLLDLGLKKYIEFENNPENKNNIIIKILKREADDSLQRSEKEILEYVCGATRGNNQITVKELEKYMKRYSTNLISTKEDIEKSTKRELSQNQIYDKTEVDKKKEVSSWGLKLFVKIYLGILILPFFKLVVYEELLLIGILSLILFIIIKSIAIHKFSKKLNPFTEKGLNEREMWKGLKKYMEDFSMLDKREVPELAIWEEFLVYATVFGIADKVLKQLKIVYKDLGENFDVNTYCYMNLMLHTDFSSSFSNAMNSAFSSAYSSGSGSGGGFSGGGGGGRRPEEAEAEDEYKNNQKYK